MTNEQTFVYRSCSGSGQDWREESFKAAREFKYVVDPGSISRRRWSRAEVGTENIARIHSTSDLRVVIVI